jgi:hypothetical protein
MKLIVLATATLLLTFSSISHAASTRAEARSQCRAETKALKGAEKQSAMKTCMAKNAPARPPSAQNQRMKTCSADFKATGKPAAERRAFMRECLAKR